MILRNQLRKNYYIRRFLKIYFSDYKWCRKFLGGHWELWVPTLPKPTVWIEDGVCYLRLGGKPPQCQYHINCEDWGA